MVKRIKRGPRQRYYTTTISLTATAIKQWNELVAKGQVRNLSMFVRESIARLHCACSTRLSD